MSRRILTTIVNVLKHERKQEEVHFHAYFGRPYPCFDRHCTSPRFDAG